MLIPFLIALIFLVAGFVQGVSGFGSALVAMPLLAMLVDVKVAVPLCVLNGLLITLFLSLQLKSHVVPEKIAPLALGCIPGVYVGVTILKRADDHIIRLALGTLLIAYAFSCLTFPNRMRTVSPGWGYLAGFLTGAIGGAFSAGGPPAIIYATHTGWSKDLIKATLSVFFLLTGIFIASAHAWTGLTTGPVLSYFAVSAAPVIAGVYAGSACYRKFDRKAYLKVIYALLLAMGCLMLGSGL